jgi:hypothetical protein
LHSTDGIRVLFYGTLEDIIASPLSEEEMFEIDIDTLDNPMILTDTFALPSLEFSVYDNVMVGNELAGYFSFEEGLYTINRPTAEEGDIVGSITVRIMIESSFRDVVIPITVKALAAQGASDLIISEYVEGGGFNKYIEIYNGTGLTVDLSEYTLELYSNSSLTVSQSVTFEEGKSLMTNNVIIVYNNGGVIYIPSNDDVENNAVINFNGDDVVVLKHNGVIIDSIGKIGQIDIDFWGDPDTVSTKDMTLVRKTFITSGDTDPYDDFDPALEWDAYPKDTATYLGSHTSD